VLAAGLIFFILIVGLPTAAGAASDRRIALIIGNGAYQHTSILQNPRNDASDLAAALRRLGFEVMQGVDLDKRSMERTIREFGVKLSGADVALFLYAGHGLQVSGQNYLLPVDAKLSTENDVDFESIALNLVLRQMEREAKTSLVLLDACRDNPLARNLARNMGTRSSQIGQGLAEVKTGVGTMIGFSTQPGNVAQDGTGRNSPYAGALIKHLETPGRDIGSVLINVRNDVYSATNGRQVPWEHTSLMGRVVLAAPAPVEDGGSDYDKQMEIAFWNAIKDSKSADLLQTYLNRFPKGTFAELARVLMQQAEKESVAQKEVVRRDEDLRRAEENKAAAEWQQREAERKATESKLAADLKKAQEEAKKTREALAAAEREREAALRAAETARRQQEDARKSAETVVASLPAPVSGQADDAALIRSLQKELRRVGCDPGKEDGIWGNGVRGAIDKFNRYAKASLQSGGPSQDGLAVIIGKKARVCPLECGEGRHPVGERCVAVAAPKTPRVRENSPASKAGSSEACAKWRRCMSEQMRIANTVACENAPPGC
jgi:uncharacterized caspase-like protein